MKTNEIIRRLALMMNAYKANAAGLLPESEISACMEAGTAAIDAVKLLEQVKEEAEGVCELCRYGKSSENEPPCKTCLPRYFATGIAPLWEWFNGKFVNVEDEEEETL